MNHGRFRKNLFFVIILILYFNISALHAQRNNSQDSVLVKGIIVSEKNIPLSNIIVSIEGSGQNPVVTNEKGEFEIKSDSPDNWMVISPASDFKTKRVHLNRRNEIKVYLNPADLPSGDDKLTIITQVKNRKDIVSSFFDLKSSNVYKTSAYSIDEYMQGRVTGLNVTRRDGSPATGATVFLRGINSLYANNQPLYIVDGIPLAKPGLLGSNIEGFAYNPLLAVNMNDISSIIIAKDPIVTSAYGSKASNGVIFIETLDPSATQTSIDIDLRIGFSMAPSSYIPQLNAEQHKTLANEELFTSGMVEEFIREKYPCLFLMEDDERYINYQHNTNWQDEIFSNGSFRNVNLKVKGGDAIARYGLSFGYLSGYGVIKTTKFNSYNLRFISRLNIFRWLRMNASVSLNHNSGNLKESAKAKNTSPVLAALHKSPMLNPYQYDLEGNLLKTLSEVDELGVSNPVAIINNFSATNSNYHFISNIGFEVILTKNLMLNTNLGITYNSLKEAIFMPNHSMDHYFDNEAWNVAKATDSYLFSMNNSTYLSYKKVFNNNHSLNSTTGFFIYTNGSQFDWGMTMNAHKNDQYQSIQDGSNSLRRIGGENRRWNWISTYENLNYRFKDKYLVTASFSIDGSSRVGNEAINTVKIGQNPYGLFYSGGLGWRLSNEAFLKNVSWLDELKIRTAAGKSGNDDIGESNASDYYKSVKFRETVGMYPAIIPNRELSYENVSVISSGIDFSVLGSRIMTTVDLFKSTTDNMVILAPMEPYLGYSFRPENGGQMVNTGVELNLTFRIIDGKSFKWDLQTNLSKIKNEITEIKGDKLVTDIEGGQVVNMVGEAANSFYGYIYDGVYATTAEANEANLKNNKLVSYRAGDSKYLDISGPENQPDGIINQYDKTVLGTSMPNVFGGIQNTFSYKNWTLDALINFVSGNSVYNYVRYQNEKMTGLENQSGSVTKRWTQEGQVTNIPRALWNDPVGNSDFSSRWIEDGSYIRLQNISLSYRMHNRFLVFRNAEFYFSAVNILTISNYLGYDPEFAISYQHAEQGVDYGQCPQTRQILFGIKLGL